MSIISGIFIVGAVVVGGVILIAGFALGHSVGFARGFAKGRFGKK